ncbi:MAG TPA: CotS family spore coat protein [Bacillota bacterium]|nr:CotS family spore coat protein [Bacillota bacterium]
MEAKQGAGLNSEITRLLAAHWGIRAAEIRKVRDVYRIESEGEYYCFKEVKEKPEKLHFMAQVLNHVRDKGFTRFAGFRPTLKGEMFVQEQGLYYMVSPWLEGCEPDYGDRVQMGEAAGCLAEFHVATEGFTPVGEVKAKVKMDKWPRKLKKQLIEIVDYCSRAENSRNPDSFELLIREYSGWLGQQTLMACQLLSGSAFEDVSKMFAGKYPICHGDTASRNFLIDQNGKGQMIDFDSMAIDLPVVDLWRLLRRTLRKGNWDFAICERLLSCYQAIRPLCKEELQVLYAFLHFPERPWRMAKRYYEDEYSPEEREKLRERVEEYLLPWQEKNRFLETFAEHYGIMGGGGFENCCDI